MACAVHKSGDRNKKRNSNGSVTPAKNAVVTVGINIAATFFRFSGRAVFQSAKAIPIGREIEPKFAKYPIDGCIVVIDPAFPSSASQMLNAPL